MLCEHELILRWKYFLKHAVEISFLKISDEKKSHSFLLLLSLTKIFIFLFLFHAWIALNLFFTFFSQMGIAPLLMALALLMMLANIIIIATKYLNWELLVRMKKIVDILTRIVGLRYICPTWTQYFFTNRTCWPFVLRNWETAPVLLLNFSTKCAFFDEIWYFF